MSTLDEDVGKVWRTNLHCVRAVSRVKVKSTPGSVVLQLFPLRDGPTCVIKLVPPDPKPVASDMTKNIF